MTPKFDKLLGALRENGAGAAATSSVGDISYFAADPGAGWLKCDGKVYDRSAYPGYEAQRPDPAFVFAARTQFTDPPGGVVCHVGGDISVWPVAGKIIRYDMSTDSESVVRTHGSITSGATSWRFENLGRLCVATGSSLYYSDDLGVSWTHVTPFPVGTSFHQYQWITAQHAVAKSNPDNYEGTLTDRIVVAVSGTKKLIHSTNGTAWTAVELTELPVNFAYTDVLNSYRPTIEELRLCTVIGTISCGVDYDGSFYIFKYNPSEISISGGDIDGDGDKFTVVLDYAKQSLVNSSGAALSSISGQVFSSPISVSGRLLLRGPELEHLYSLGTLGFLSPDRRSIESFSVADDAAFAGFIPFAGNTGYASEEVRGVGGTDFVIWSYNWEDTRRIRATLDPLKFHAPGLAPVGGAWPYVYVGA